MSHKTLELRLKLAALQERLLGPYDTGSPTFEKRKQLTEEYQKTSPLKTREEAVDLPSLDAKKINHDDFLKASDNFRTPVVIRGFMSPTKAAQQWDKEYLRSFATGQEYNVVKLQDDGSKKASVAHERVEFSEFLDHMNEKKWYLNNSTDLLHDVPQLLDELQPERVEEFFQGEVATTQLFVGGDSVWSGLHCAFNGNFFAMLEGRKEWIILGPQYSHYVFPLFSRPFIFSKSFYDLKHEAPDSFVWKIPRYRVVLEPGDLLYNAPWWWHEVQNFDDFTIACAIRFDALRAGLNFQNHALFTMMSVLPFTRMLNQLMKLKAKIKGEEYSRVRAGNAMLAKKVGKGRAAVKRGAQV